MRRRGHFHFRIILLEILEKAGNIFTHVKLSTVMWSNESKGDVTDDEDLAKAADLATEELTDDDELHDAMLGKFFHLHDFCSCESLCTNRERSNA